jgi:oligopeptidase B
VTNSALPQPPIAAKIPISVEHHGARLTDDYAWLRAENWQDVMREPAKLAPEIRTYLEAENAHTAAVLADTDPLQAELFAEMKGRLKHDDVTVPVPDGPFEYFSAFVKGGQYLRQLRRPRGAAPGNETLLLDGNIEAEGKSFWDFGGSTHSPDHKLFAYAIDENGSELYTMRVRDIATGKDLADSIPDTRGDMVWANDSQTLFYVRLDDNHRPLAVWRHTIGTPNDNDVLVFEEKDTGYYVSLGKTQSAKLILINSHDHQSGEIYFVDADAPTSPLTLISPRRNGHEYNVEHHGDRLIITTNSGAAEDFRIVETPLSKPGEENWTDLVPHKSGRLILETTAYRSHLVRLEREESLPRIIIRDMASGDEHAIKFDEEAYGLGMFSGDEFDTTTLRFSYSSLTTPAETYDYDLAARTRVLRKRQEVPSGHNPADYVTRRLFAPAADGELVPISLLYHKDTPLDGSAPVFLYGYGAYGISIPASFSTGRLSLVDRGMIFAIAHIRGGKDKGYRWYTTGKLEQKTNTFTDFIAAGEHLIAKGYTRRKRIVACGGSAGGMLMGAVANMAPDLFLGIIAQVPFVDVLNTMLDKDLPLTPPEWPEWGNPIDSARDFETIRNYSPYDNVTAKDYPHMYISGGLTDPRVTYWEPTKWVAKLRDTATSSNLLLLKINMDAGHAGVSGRFNALKEVAIDYAFALKICGESQDQTPKV